MAYSDLDGLGTPESAWQSWPGLAALPVLAIEALVPEGGRLVVVAPHPDDETLAAGGLMVLVHAAGRELALVAVTDGTASHPGSRRWTPAALAATRPRETAKALAMLGIDPPVTRLGLPDAEVRDSDVAAGLHPVLRAGDTVLATWRGDAHPDHEAVGRGAACAAASAGVPLVEVPVWAWHWAEPGDPRVPWARASRVLIPPEVLQRKRSAVSAYASQLQHDDALALGAVLPKPVLERLLRPFEMVLR